MIEEIGQLLHDQHAAIQGLSARAQRTVAMAYQARIDRLEKAARASFAKRNGWIVAATATDAPKLLAKDKLSPGGFGWSTYVGRVSDHDFVCREPGRGGRVAAVVCQPYRDCVAEARATAEQLGLVAHVPPDPTASIHYPGWTRFIVFTRPGVEVRWLDEQMKQLERADALMPNAGTRESTGA